MQTRTAEITTPIGRLRLVARGDTLCELEFVTGGAATAAAASRSKKSIQAGSTPRPDSDRAGNSGQREAVHGAASARSAAPLGTSHPLVRRLRAYFEGDIAALDDIEVEPAGTIFERRVWRELRRIRPGKPITYGELARRAGSPGAARAAGAACGRNPIAIVIPCHRVVGATGSLTGYGGGIERKRWLLRHETGPELL